MMTSDISTEIHNIEDKAINLSLIVERLTVLIEIILNDIKINKKKINSFEKFKNKIIGFFTFSHIILAIVITLVAIL